MSSRRGTRWPCAAAGSYTVAKHESGAVAIRYLAYGRVPAVLSWCAHSGKLTGAAPPLPLPKRRGGKAGKALALKPTAAPDAADTTGKRCAADIAVAGPSDGAPRKKARSATTAASTDVEMASVPAVAPPGVAAAFAAAVTSAHVPAATVPAAAASTGGMSRCNMCDVSVPAALLAMHESGRRHRMKARCCCCAFYCGDNRPSCAGWACDRPRSGARRAQEGQAGACGLGWRPRRGARGRGRGTGRSEGEGCRRRRHLAACGTRVPVRAVRD